MQFDRHTYEVIGVKMVEEVFKQAAEMNPPCDEPKPSLFKRLLHLVSNKPVEPKAAFNPCDEDLSAQPSH